MRGKIIDINNLEAFIALEDGNTLQIPLSRLPIHHHVGETVEIDSDFYSSFSSTSLAHDTIHKDNLIDFF
ncbi:hypothetical protein [Inconstantimicrobium mannanitabidum]|uniref:Uncharacterized protein n=1 Tax=Inconstantimicrobium mannanitabidum TaxID=1604901 RepID=A0ACB5RHZ5_9CLOT|nr:hypothetical protein [Clostridium sp. TW13]GKX68694.1 hypothetical protein rsdtw13_39520 [Clostridium sp. TW13]